VYCAYRAREDVGVEAIGCGCRPTREVPPGSNCRRRASGDYVPRSRDIRGIGRSFKITPKVSNPVNKGPPAFGAERSVKPSAQPTLVRTQHPPPRKHNYIRRNSIDTIEDGFERRRFLDPSLYSFSAAPPLQYRYIYGQTGAPSQSSGLLSPP
jgi:hypothetical protein